VDGLPKTGLAWVRDGIAKCNRIMPPCAGHALTLMMDALAIAAAGAGKKLAAAAVVSSARGIAAKQSPAGMKRKGEPSTTLANAQGSFRSSA
jgi:hypothetical protein